MGILSSRDLMMVHKIGTGTRGFAARGTRNAALCFRFGFRNEKDDSENSEHLCVPRTGTGILWSLSVIPRLGRVVSG